MDSSRVLAVQARLDAAQVKLQAELDKGAARDKSLVTSYEKMVTSYEKSIEELKDELKMHTSTVVQKDVYAAFREKLKLCHVDHPDAQAMARLALNFPAQMQTTSSASIDPEVALHLYQKVKDLPGTEACATMVKEDHISINGPWLPDHPNLVTAVDLDSGSLLAVKLLPPTSQQQKDAAQSEKRAVKLLKLDTAPVDNALVPTQIHGVKVCQKFAVNSRGGRRLQQAVTAMHEVKLLHTDLKAANVFVDSSGAWFLGDFGACNIFGTKIKYCTEAMYPGGIKFQPVAPKYDWGLLVVLLAIEMDKKNWVRLCSNTEPQKMVLEPVLQKCHSEHQGLQVLFNELVVAAGWDKDKANV